MENGLKEAELAPFLERHLKVRGFITAVEVRTAGAVPDIVAVLPNPDRVAARIDAGQLRVLSRPLFWNLLKLIPDRAEDASGVEIAQLAGAVGLSETHLRRAILRPLELNGFVESQGDRIIKINGFHPYSDTVASFELKLTNWKAAAHQALRHKQFADMTYVVMPSLYIGRALRALDAFRLANIGLLEVDCEGEGSVLSHLEPMRELPKTPASQMTILERLWPKVVREFWERQSHASAQLALPNASRSS